MRKPSRESQGSIPNFPEAGEADIVVVAIIAPEPLEVPCHYHLGAVTASDEVGCSTRGMIDGHFVERMPMADSVCFHAVLAVSPETLLREAYFCLFVEAYRVRAILAVYCGGIFGCGLETTNSIPLAHLDVHPPAELFHERTNT